MYRLAKWLLGTTNRVMFNSKIFLAIHLNKTISDLDIDKTIFLSPQRIVYNSLHEFALPDSIGAVIDGDWDRLNIKFEDSDVYLAFKQVFVEKRNWNETVFYKRILDLLNKNKLLWNCANEYDLQQRCKNLEKLFQSIKEGGYKTQLSLAAESAAPPTSWDEIAVNVGRDGDLLFCDGKHRLSIAKILRLEKIPVKIAVRHRNWMVFVEELYQYARSLNDGKLYQPLTHPDLEAIPADPTCEERFLRIREHVSAKKGRLLDIGANLGYFCHRFEDEGFDCYAVEQSANELHFLRKLRRAENKRFEIIDRSIFDWPQRSEIYFDVVLALNIFHHFVKTKDRHDQLVLLLRDLQMGELFFQSARQDEPQMKDAYRNYSQPEFLNLIMRTSKLKHAEIIGKSNDDRPIYRLYT
jgi:2-polyprenyl-3-methyl-5-hydroxy-6-metoxy-1,4-benzoquinol methylase